MTTRSNLAGIFVPGLRLAASEKREFKGRQKTRVLDKSLKSVYSEKIDKNISEKRETHPKEGF